MARRIILGIVPVALLLSFFVCRYARRPDSRTLAAQWLARDCSVTEQAQLETEIRDRGASREPLFIKAFEDGPPQAALADLNATTDAAYQRRQQQFGSGKTYGLSATDIQALRSPSLADEQQDVREDFDHSYRAAALNALGIIGRPEGRQLLQRLAADQASPFQ